MTNEEIKQFRSKAIGYAISRGMQNDAEDFAQEACIAYVTRSGVRLRSLFIDYLRQQYGRSRERGYRPKIYERLRFTSINEPSEDEPRTPFYQPVGDIGRQPEFERDDWRSRIYLRGSEGEAFDLIAFGETQKEVAGDLGLTEPRVTQIMREVKQKTKDAMVLSETLDRYHDDKEYSKLEIDWITL